MSGRARSAHARESIPSIGRWVPTASLHLLFLAVAGGLCVLVLASPFWLAVGLVLAVAGTLLPKLVPTWWLLLLLGLSQYSPEPSTGDVVLHLLIAGVHLLHVLGSLIRFMPWDGRLQLVALAPPVKRFVLVQVGAQAVAVGAMSVFRGDAGTVPRLSIVAAVMLGVLALVLARGRRRVGPG